MILGVSGRKQSGKDTVGKIIQMLTANKDIEGKFSWEEIQKESTLEDYTDWEVKKFADKLKDMVCMLIGCTREQLEDETFKNTELGEEWDKIEAVYSDGYGTCKDIFDVNFDFNTLLDAKNRVAYIHNKKTLKMTPRLLLQLIGTECGRDIIHPNIWVNSVFSEYKPLYGYQTTDSKINIGDISISIPELDVDKRVFPNWIITDCRFPNELQAIKDRNGISIRINRNSKQRFDKNEHISETSLDNAQFDYVINNDGNIEELIEKVKQILEKESII